MKTIKELEEIRKSVYETVKMRSGVPAESDKMSILVCGGTGCTSSKSPKIVEEFEKGVQERNLGDKVEVIKTGCFGLCAKGPIVIVYPRETFYTMVKPEDVSDESILIVAKDIVKKIEDELEYPGQIKVNVIREVRAIEYAK